MANAFAILRKYPQACNCGFGMDDDSIIVLRLRAVGEILLRRRPKDLMAALQLLESLAQASETVEEIGDDTVPDQSPA